MGAKLDIYLKDGIYLIGLNIFHQVYTTFFKVPKCDYEVCERLCVCLDSLCLAFKNGTLLALNATKEDKQNHVRLSCSVLFLSS